MSLRRELGLLDTTCLVIGTIVGVGIFFTPSRVAVLAGSPELALAAWAFGGVIALLGALTFAELGALCPRSGGQYEILRDSYGPAIAFVFVFCNATAIQAGAIAIIALVSAQHIAAALAVEIGHLWLTLLSLLLIIGLVVANTLGVRWGSRIQNLTVYAKVTTLLAVTLLALWSPGAVSDEPAIESSPAQDTGLFSALVPTLFAFGGWQLALWVGGEVKDPGRNLPRAIIGGVLVVVIIYLLVNWAYLSLLGFDGVIGSRALAADAVASVVPATSGRVVALAVALSAVGVLNALLLAGPRLIYALSLDGRFFSVFSRVSVRHGTPVPAILLLGVLSLALLLGAGANGIDRLLTGVVLVDGVFFVLTGLALLILRRKKPDAERPVRVPGYPVVPPGSTTRR